MNALNRLKSFDAYPKTLEDFRVRTVSGAAVTIISSIFILWLFFSELSFYMTIEVTPELFVDTSRGEKLRINMDVIFPTLPCAFVSVDAMDISGEHQLDVAHNIFKKRLAPNGVPVVSSPIKEEGIGQPKKDPFSDEEKAKLESESYCGSCYGSEERPDQCCNTCDEVQLAYRKKGWAFSNHAGIIQCLREGFQVNMEEQKGEGCQIYGYLMVNKVAGNFHFAPGKSYQQHSIHVHDLQPYKGVFFNMTHVFNKLSFGAEIPGIVNPLDNVVKISRTEGVSEMFQYFVKIVPTTYINVHGKTTNTNQFSVTEHHKPILMNGPEDGHGLPGVFVIYDLSPIMVQFTETSKSFAHFLTSLCAIIGGVFTVAGIIDSFIYHSMKSLEKKIELGKAH